MLGNPVLWCIKARYVSQNIVAIAGTLRLNRFTCCMYLIDRFHIR